jgi:two-component system KDP operon response regulator KdpE
MKVTLVIGERPERSQALAEWLGVYGLEAIPCGRDAELLVRSLNAQDVSSILVWVDGTPESAEFFESLRALTAAPILAMSVAGDLDNIVSYLDRGAAGFIPGHMPISSIADKIRTLAPDQVAIAERTETVLQIGDLEIDLESRDVTRGRTRIPLTNLEFKLLRALAENAGRACSRRMLLSRVWGDEFVDRPQYLRLYMGYLRQKLEKDPARPRLLRTDWGYGYRLVVPRKSARRVTKPAFRPAG